MKFVAPKDFIVRIPARFLKDDSLSGDARLLRSLIAAYADGKTGHAYVSGKTLQAKLHWGRRRRENAQAELSRKGWLRLGWKRGAHAVFSRRTYTLCDPKVPVAQFEHSGKAEQLITDHSQSQVRSPITTSLTESKIAKTSIRPSNLT